MKGPLSNHTIGPPEKKSSKSRDKNVTCPEHEKEKVALYCHNCNKAVCYMCKEFGKHKQHRVELLEAVFRKAKVHLAYKFSLPCLHQGVLLLTKCFMYKRKIRAHLYYPLRIFL